MLQSFFHLNRLFQPIRLSFHTQHVFRKACQCMDGFTDSSVLVCYYHHSCHRSGRTSLLMVTDQIQSVSRSICIRQSICLHAISFIIRFIGSMLYTDNICLADDLIYTYEYCTCAYQLFSRFSCLAAPEAAHLELSGHRPACSTLNY